MQVSTAEFKKGLRIVFDGQPYAIVDFQHVKPGKGGAFVRTKLKHMRLGKVIDNTFRAGEKVDLVEYDEKHMQFLYKDDRYHFMDTETYEQVSLSADEVRDAREDLKENTEVDVLYIDGAPPRAGGRARAPRGRPPGAGPPRPAPPPRGAPPPPGPPPANAGAAPGARGRGPAGDPPGGAVGRLFLGAGAPPRRSVRPRGRRG